MQTKTQKRLEEILAEWDLDDSATNTVTLSSSVNTGSITSPVTGTIGVIGSISNSIYTTGSTASPWLTSNPTGAKIQLDGETADITVNGWSLVAAVKRIEDRLDLFQPNPELEQEWSELKALGEQYRALEQHIRDKQATWDRLTAQPAPNAD